MIYLSRRIVFSSAHRYFQKKFSEAENKKIFGRCYTEHGHGHNYVLEITLGGTPDPLTGMVINLVDVDHILKEVTDPLDHHHLNFDVPAFKEVVPTTENIAKYCFDEVEQKLLQLQGVATAKSVGESAASGERIKLIRARLYEADDLWADCYG